MGNAADRREDPTAFVVSADAAVRDSLIALVESAGLQSETFPSLQAFLEVEPGRKGCLVFDANVSDLSDPERPSILGVARGKDQAAGEQCLDRLSQEQRDNIQTHRVDMGAAYPAACARRLKQSKLVIDRFHRIFDNVHKNNTADEGSIRSYFQVLRTVWRCCHGQSLWLRLVAFFYKQLWRRIARINWENG